MTEPARAPHLQFLELLQQTDSSALHWAEVKCSRYEPSAPLTLRSDTDLCEKEPKHVLETENRTRRPGGDAHLKLRTQGSPGPQATTQREPSPAPGPSAAHCLGPRRSGRRPETRRPRKATGVPWAQH